MNRQAKKNAERLLLEAGWKCDAWGYWVAKPGTAPPGPWKLETSIAHFHLGNAMRSLFERGWNVPREYIGVVNIATWGPYVSHPAKSPKFILVSTALVMEELPPLDPCVYSRFKGAVGR